MKKTLRKLVGTTFLVASLMVGFAVFQPASVSAQVDCTSDIKTGGISGGADCAAGTGTPATLTGEGGVFTVITNVLLFIIGAIAVIMLIIGGIRYTTSNGDSNQVTAAKNTIMYAIIGLIVAILASALVNFVIGSFVSS